MRAGNPTKLCSRGLHCRSIQTSVPCGQCAAIDALEDATAVVAAVLPSPGADVQQLVAEAARTGEQRRLIAAHLRVHPDGLVSGVTAAPPALVRLARILSRAGVAGVVVPGKDRKLCPAGRHERSGWTHPGITCGRCDAEAALADAVSVVAGRLPELGAETIAVFVSGVARAGEARRRLVAHLGVHPDALVSGDSNVPLVVVRLVNALVDGGVGGVRLLRCVGCAKPRHHLHLLTEGGRLCDNCHRRRHQEPCSACGRTMPVAGRSQAGDPFCGTCRAKDPSTWRPCSRCGTTTQIVTRVAGQGIGRCCYAPSVVRCTVCGLAKGTKPWKTRRPVCPDCQGLPTTLCSVCGREAPIPEEGAAPVCAVCRTNPGLPCRECGRPTPARDRDGAPRCFDCYRRPTKACGRCGRVRPVVRLARDGEPDLCGICWTGPTVACESCGEVRPCRGERRQRMLCSKCCPVAPQPCAHCGRTRRVVANWIEGPICQACYGRALAAKATCPGCGWWRRLRTYQGFEDKICSDCAGAEPYAVCRTCGVEDCLYDKDRCPACALAVRLAAIFGAEGQRGQLQPVYEALRTLECPKDVIRWLQLSPVTDLLRRFASGEVPVSFAALDALPRSPSVWFVEHLLTTTGVLPGRDPVLARFELWVVDWLDSVGVAEHERLLRRFATWEILRPLRAASARRHLSDHRHNSAKARLKAAHTLLDFLARRHRSLAECRQADLETWGATAVASRRKNAQPFFSWAVRQRLAPALTYPPRTDACDPNVVFGDGEWTLARHLLHDDGIDPHDRVAGLLVVLYAQTPARISRLTAENVTATETTVLLRLGVTPLRVPPPMADHVRVLLGKRRQTSAGKIAGETQWLFPGHHPGRPVHTMALAARLRDHGVRTSTDRPATLAHLAAMMPAVIVADLLGISAQTAVAWSEAAARTRADYVSHR